MSFFNRLIQVECGVVWCSVVWYGMVWFDFFLFFLFFLFFFCFLLFFCFCVLGGFGWFWVVLGGYGGFLVCLGFCFLYFWCLFAGQKFTTKVAKGALHLVNSFSDKLELRGLIAHRLNL